MGVKVGITTMKLVNKPTSGKARHRGNLRSIIGEAIPWEEKMKRWCSDEDFNPEKSSLNTYEGHSTGHSLFDALLQEANSYSESLRADGKRGLREDAVLCIATIVKPPAEWINSLPEDERNRFFRDSRDVLSGIYGYSGGKSNLRAAVTHRDEYAMHEHDFWVPRTEDGRYCAKEVYGLKLFRKLNKDYPEKMREKGWDIESTLIYDHEKAKDMSEDELETYKQECSEIRKSRKTGLSSKDYKEQKRKKELDNREKQVEFREEKNKLRQERMDKYEQEMDAWVASEEKRLEEKEEKLDEKLAEELDRKEEDLKKELKEKNEQKEKELEQKENEINERDKTLIERAKELDLRLNGIAAMENSIKAKKQALAKRESDIAKREENYSKVIETYKKERDIFQQQNNPAGANRAEQNINYVKKVQETADNLKRREGKPENQYSL